MSKRSGERPTAGELFGVPYNFERPKLSRLLAAYWQPDEGMLVAKPFGIGYTLNLANWRSWVVLAVAGALLWQEAGDDEGAASPDPVEVVVDE